MALTGAHRANPKVSSRNARPSTGRLTLVKAPATTTMEQATTAAGIPQVAKPTLFDVHVSNNGARVRHVIYKKGLVEEFDIVSPATVGGLTSAAYKAMNPQCKMPLLLMPDGTALPESEVIVQYILDKWFGVGPSLIPKTPEAKALAALATRIHDMYITTIQACMYRKMPLADRVHQMQQLHYQLDVLEGICQGPYITGEEMSSADSALFPTFVFMTSILPEVFGWRDVFAGRPKLAAWWAAVQEDPAAAKVIAEVRGGLEGWFAKDRWADLGIKQQVAEAAGALTY